MSITESWGEADMYGRVKYANNDDGYGYIDAGQSGLNNLRFTYQKGESYEAGQTVSFEVENSGAGKPYATDVQVRTERNVSTYNTEDKQKWYAEGAQLELTFLEKFKGKLPQGLALNPEKESDPTVIDLVEGDGSYADLKTQNTPFFTARKKGRSLDPQFTVTFNRKDYQRYKELYPECTIYFWVNWTQTEWRDIRVAPMEGVWAARFSDMKDAIENDRVALHPYKYRVNDKHNAKDSYLFDLRSDIFKRLI